MINIICFIIVKRTMQWKSLVFLNYPNQKTKILISGLQHFIGAVLIVFQNLNYKIKKELD